MRQICSKMRKMKDMRLFVLVLLLANYVLSAPPAELTLDVALVPPYDSISEHYMGGKTVMEVKVAFPSGTTAGTIIELLPSTNVTIMALGTVTVTPPATNRIASITGSHDLTRHVTDETLGQKVRHSTRGVINLGDVTVSDASGPEADYTYTIQFEAFVVTVDGLSDNSSHWASAGVEYDNSNNIWVGQILHYIRTGTLANGKTPSFQMQDVTELKRLSTTPITFEAWIPYPNSFIAVEAISLSTTDDHLRVVSLKCTGAGTNYDFGIPTMLNYPLLEIGGVDCAQNAGGSRRLRVELGNVPNKGSREADPTGDIDKILFEAMVHMKKDSILNDDYPFGVGVEIDGSEVWVATVNVTATAEDPITYPLTNLTASDGLTTKQIGEAFIVRASIEIPRSRGTVDAGYKIETMKNGGGDPGIMVSQAFIESSGFNVECSSVTSTFLSSVSGDVVDISYITITATNHGQNSTDSNDDLVHINVAFVGMTGYAVDSGLYDIKFTSNDSVHTKTIQYTMSGQAPYDTNTNHTFELAGECGDDQVVPEETTFDLLLTVTTQRGSNPESLQIEFPIPANITDGMYSVCAIEVVKLGKNLICYNPTHAISTANYTTLPDGTHEYVAMRIQPACNVDVVDDIEEDKLVLRIKSKFKTGVTIIPNEEYWYGIGSKYTSTQIWVAQYLVKGLPTFDFGGPVIITAVNVLNNNYTLPGNYVLSKSYDGTVFESISFVASGTSDNGTHTTYELQKPTMATHAGLVTQNCNSACGISYDFTYVSLKEYIDIFGDDSQVIMNNMIFALDNDVSTCMSLPIQGQSPPVFWSRINTTILNINLQSFTVNVTGEGISCDRHGAEKVLQISYPVSSSVGKFHGDVKYCRNTFSEFGAKNTCGYTCMCPDTAECSEIIIFFANSNNAGSWKMCDLKAANI